MRAVSHNPPPCRSARLLIPRFLIAAVLALTPSVASADQEWLTVGDPGNAADQTGIGDVAYEFQIMKHEVTVQQYVDFLNAVASETDPHQLWERAMGHHVITDLGQGGIRQDVPQCIYRQGEPGSWRYVPAPDWERRPVIFVTCFSAMRFANWIHNGKGNGDTESGAYRLQDGVKVQRSVDAKVWLPSEDEWYKAAYYQKESDGGPPGDYWLFPMSTMERPDQVRDKSDSATAANYSTGFGKIMEVGSFPNSKSPCGALDMGGNVWEWTDSAIYASKRVLRGGATAHTWHKLQSTVRSNASPDRWYPDTGFRLARRVQP